MIYQRAFIALACTTLLAACGGADNNDTNGADSTSIAPAPAGAPAPITPPVASPSDTTMAGQASGADTMAHDSMPGMAHDTMKHDTAKKM